jgi:hypothetical protein
MAIGKDICFNRNVLANYPFDGEAPPVDFWLA